MIPSHRSCDREPAGSTPGGQNDVSQSIGEGAAAAPRAPASRRLTLLAAGLIVLAALAAYHNSFAGPFIYDDVGAIVQNPTIRQLWPIGQALSPPRNGETVSGRPLLNLSLAINYALGGLHVWGYHAANLLIHIAAALLLFGILRRTFLTPTLRDRFGGAASVLALAGALIWTVHPLQTESVTYLVQRAESLAGFCYLLTLYCVIRGAEGTVPFFAAHRPVSLGSVPGEKGDCPPAPFGCASWRWYAAAVLACLSGMACKEIVVTAPLLVLLYDRTFLAGSFSEAWRRRWGLYLGLAATWGLLGYLVLSAGLIGRPPELETLNHWSYARSQPGVILHYLRLSVWPHPLCLSYAWPIANTPGEILPGAIVTGLLLAATLWGLWGRKAWGFLGAWFLLILAPTSSIWPLRQLAFEHRMYLSLAAVVVLAVAGGYALWDRWLPWLAGPNYRATLVRWAGPMVVCAAVLLVLGCATVARNSDYRSSLAIWQDTVDKRPLNPVARNSLGNALSAVEKPREAIPHYQQALRLKPDYADAYYNLANTLAKVGSSDEAIADYEQALRLKPGYADAHYNLANTLANVGRNDEAIAHYQQALRCEPDHAEAQINLGNALFSAGRMSEAIAQYHEALRLQPDHARAHNNLGLALAAAGRSDEAIGNFNQALRLKPDYARAHNNLGAVLATAGRTAEAIEHYRQALRLEPDYAEAHNNLGNALAGLSKTDEAIEHYRQAVRLKPDYAQAYNNLGAALAQAGRIPEAIESWEQALKLKPSDAMARYNLGNTLAGFGRTQEAIEHYNRLLQLMPDSKEVCNNLAWLLATSEGAQGGDPTRAVQLAERMCELGGRESAACLDTLAAAYAAAGRFPDAVAAAQKALQLAESTGQAPLTELIQARLELYRAGRAYRQPQRSSP